MDIREHQTLLHLLGGSFSVVNRALGPLFCYLLVAILLSAGQLALLWVGIPSLIVRIIGAVCSAFLGVAFMRIIAVKTEEMQESLFTSFAASFIPAIYIFIYQIILGVLAFVTGLVAALSGPLLIVPLLAMLYIFVRLAFAPAAIALRGQGPVSALTYSWQLTDGHFFYTLGVLFLIGLIPLLAMGAIGYGLYAGIPLYFADSFHLANLSAGWIVTLVLLALLVMFVCVAMCAFLVLVFLNLDYTQNAPATPRSQGNLTQEPTVVFGPENNVLPPGAGNAVTQQDVQVLQASVQTSTEDHNLDEHLSQVYQPKPQDVVQYQEEDRMPTILFDDEMAQQIERERTLWEQKKSQAQERKEDDGTSTIKMSK